MQGEEHYIDQLFKDHFEDFSKSPSEEVWNGIVKEGTMANGNRFGLPGGWKSGLTLLSTVMLSLVLLSGSDVTLTSEDSLVEQPQYATVLSSFKGEVSSNRLIESIETIYNAASQKTSTGLVAREKRPSAKATPINNEPDPFTQTVVLTRNEAVGSTPVLTESPIKKSNQFLRLSYVPKPNGLADSTSAFLSQEAVRQLKKDLFATTYYKKKRGGHWFVSGGLILDGSIANINEGFGDGLVFGAGKYLTGNSFMEIALRGTWGVGFNMRATYTQLLLPGRFRPFVQAGLAWDYDLDLRAGVGLMFQPSPIRKWRAFASVSYEKGSQLFDQRVTNRTILEIGLQLKLSGTEPLLSDNNWMNSVPHYKLPRKLYLEGSSNWTFFDKTRVNRVSFYAGKNLTRRLYARAGVRLGRDQVTLPAHLQYHFLVRRKLRFGAYSGPSLNVSQLGIGAELGLIAYYEVSPGWSLYVAPVLLDNSDYQDRIFETGVRYYLGSKKKKN